MKKALTVTTLILAAGCAFSIQKGTTSTPTTPVTLTSVVLNSQMQPAALQILATHCDSCHGTENMGGLNSILDPNHLIQQGIIVPGNPGASILNQYVSKGLMPPTGPLAAADIATLQSWVQGTATTTTTSAPATLAQQVTTILTTNCVSCHGSTSNGGLSGITNLASLAQGGWIVPNNPAGSPIYSQISAGTMPPTGSLAQGDIQTIASWINSGAPAN